jgi:hypothetical protein
MFDGGGSILVSQPWANTIGPVLLLVGPMLVNTDCWSNAIVNGCHYWQYHCWSIVFDPMVCLRSIRIAFDVNISQSALAEYYWSGAIVCSALLLALCYC